MQRGSFPLLQFRRTSARIKETFEYSSLALLRYLLFNTSLCLELFFIITVFSASLATYSHPFRGKHRRLQLWWLFVLGNLLFDRPVLGFAQNRVAFFLRCFEALHLWLMKGLFCQLLVGLSLLQAEVVFGMTLIVCFRLFGFFSSLEELLASSVRWPHVFDNRLGQFLFVGCVSVFDVAFVTHPKLSVISKCQAFRRSQCKLRIKITSQDIRSPGESRRFWWVTVLSPRYLLFEWKVSLRTLV